jgi:hypothetical protein
MLGQVATAADDPGIIVDAQQIRQSLYDPSMGPVADLGVDPNIPPGQPDITVTGHATPMWPLWLALALVGYSLYHTGRNY